MSEVLERALADLAEHPNSSAREISRRLGVLDDRRVFKALDLAAYDGKCQRTRTGNGPWRWEIPPAAARAEDDREIHESHDPEPDGQRLYPGGQACRRCGRFVAFERLRYQVTDSGVAPCRSVPLELRTTRHKVH